MATANDSNRPSARARSYESKISDGKVTVYNYGREIGYCGALADLVAAGICTSEASQTGQREARSTAEGELPRCLPPRRKSALPYIKRRHGRGLG